MGRGGGTYRDNEPFQNRKGIRANF
jgi:hypothetical protein